MVDTRTGAVGNPRRLAALRELALLDTQAEEAFDRLSRLATTTLGVPVALISLVDEDRQFFKSCVGLGEPWASTRETPLSHSFCRHAVELAEPLIIDDARNHPLVHDNPAIEDLGVEAYAGIPLVTSHGEVLGSFCAIDTAPRSWTEHEIAILQDLAAAAMTEIELRSAARTLSDNQARLRLALKAGGLGSWELDLKANLLTTSGTTRANFGRAPDEPLSYEDHFAAIHPEDRERVRAEVTEAVEGHADYDTEYRVQWPDGSLHWIMARGQPFYAPDGSPERMVGVTLNITSTRGHEEERARLLAQEQHERIRAEMAEQTLAAIIEQVPVGIIVADAEGRTVLMNEAGRRIRDGFPETSRYQLRDPATGSEIRNEETAIARAVTGQTVEGFEYTVHAPGGTAAWIKASASPLFDSAGTVSGAVAVLVDVTDDRNEEQEKSDFLSAAAHDLKSPLTTIKGFTQILLRRLARGTIDSEQTRQDLEQIVRTVTQMSGLISELLDATRVETGRALELNVAPMDLASALDALIDVHRQTSPDHQIEVEITAGGLEGIWDGERLERALDNILTNAIKYSPDGSTVTVEVTREDTERGPMAVVRVTDQGIGIPEDDLPHIFDRYYRARNASSQAMGSGFGLTAARHIIEQHGGTIAATSSEGRGSTFTIMLPLEGPSSQG